MIAIALLSFYDFFVNGGRYTFGLLVIFLVLVMAREYRKGDFRAWKKNKIYENLGVNRIKPSALPRDGVLK